MRRSFWSCQGGNVAILFSLALVPVLGSVGAAIDYSRATQARAELQRAADGAALAAAPLAAELQDTTARKAFSSNVTPDKYHEPPLVTVGAEPRRSATVRAEAALPTVIAHLLGHREMKLAVAATAVVDQSPVCLLLLDPTRVAAFSSLGLGLVDAPACEAHVWSDHRTAFHVTGVGGINLKRACIRGEMGGIALVGVAPGTMQEHCQPVQDPYAGRLPVPPSSGCTVNASWLPGLAQTTLQPGTYCGNFTYTGAFEITLKPGLYVLKNASWTFIGATRLKGEGVTIYLEGDGAKISNVGTLDLQLKAPETGPYAGLLLYQQPGTARRSLSLIGAAGHRLEGLVYLPTHDLNFTGALGQGWSDMTLVAQTLAVTGVSSWKIRPYTRQSITTAGKVRLSQ